MWISCGLPPTSRGHARPEMFFTFICSSTSSRRTCTMTVRLISESRHGLGGGPVGSLATGGAVDGPGVAPDDGGPVSLMTGVRIVAEALGLRLEPASGEPVLDSPELLHIATARTTTTSRTPRIRARRRQ